MCRGGGFCTETNILSLIVATDVPEEEGSIQSRQALAKCTRFSCSSAKLIIELGSNAESHVASEADLNSFREAIGCTQEAVSPAMGGWGGW